MIQMNSYFELPLPPVLIIQLKRYYYSNNETRKNSKFIKFPMNLEIPLHCINNLRRNEPDAKLENRSYKLVSSKKKIIRYSCYKNYFCLLDGYFHNSSFTLWALPLRGSLCCQRSLTYKSVDSLWWFKFKSNKRKWCFKWYRSLFIILCANMIVVKREKRKKGWYLKNWRAFFLSHFF